MLSTSIKETNLEEGARSGTNAARSESFPPFILHGSNTLTSVHPQSIQYPDNSFWARKPIWSCQSVAVHQVAC